MFKIDNNKIVRSNSCKVDKTVIDLSKSYKSKNNKSKKSMHISNIKAIEKLIFLTLNVKKTFNHLR